MCGERGLRSDQIDVVFDVDADAVQKGAKADCFDVVDC